MRRDRTITQKARVQSSERFARCRARPRPRRRQRGDGGGGSARRCRVAVESSESQQRRRHFTARFECAAMLWLSPPVQPASSLIEGARRQSPPSSPSPSPSPSPSSPPPLSPCSQLFSSDYDRSTSVLRLKEARASEWRQTNESCDRR